MVKKWEELTADEKQEEMFNKWLSPQGVEFVSPQAEKAYKERVTRIKDAIQLKKKPDRIPVLPLPSFSPRTTRVLPRRMLCMITINVSTHGQNLFWTLNRMPPWVVPAPDQENPGC